jgi:hypothetical protein
MDLETSGPMEDRLFCKARDYEFLKKGRLTIN